MTFSDIFKSSFLEKSVSFSALDTAIALVMAFAIGLFIFLIYKKTFSGVMYSATFGVSLVALSLIHISDGERFCQCRPRPHRPASRSRPHS